MTHSDIYNRYVIFFLVLCRFSLYLVTTDLELLLTAGEGAPKVGIASLEEAASYVEARKGRCWGRKR